MLALVAGELRKDSALLKAVAKLGEVLVYDVDRKKIVEWVVQQFAANGQRVDRELARSLVDAVVPEGLEPDLHHLANEVAKLATWAGGDPVDWESVRELVVPFGEMPSFTLTDAIGRRDVAARARGDRGVVRARVVASARHRAAARRRGRAPPRAPAGEQASPRGGLLEPGDRVPPEAAPLLRAEARPTGGRASPRTSSATQSVRLAELDHALKGGSRLPGDLELERALVDVTRGRAVQAA